MKLKPGLGAFHAIRLGNRSAGMLSPHPGLGLEAQKTALGLGLI